MHSDFAYAQARMQARLGERLTAAEWRALEGARALTHFIDQGRTTTLRRHLGSVHDAMPVHDIERSMRDQAANTAKEVADWCPKAWRAPVKNLSTLLDLPVRPGEGGALPTRAAAESWFGDWSASLPRGRMSSAVLHFAGEVGEALDGKGLGGGASSLLRTALERLLLRRFRSATATPVAVLAFLGLTFIDLERLRGGLVRRRLFGTPEREEAA